MKLQLYLFGPAESHPHFESSEEKLNHFVVLEIHSRTIQLCPCTPIIPQQDWGNQPQKRQAQYGKACMEHQWRQGIRGAGRHLARTPQEQSMSASTQQRQTGGADAVVAVHNRVEELEWRKRGKKSWKQRLFTGNSGQNSNSQSSKIMKRLKIEANNLWTSQIANRCLCVQM